MFINTKKTFTNLIVIQHDKWDQFDDLREFFVTSFKSLFKKRLNCFAQILFIIDSFFVLFSTSISKSK